MIVTRDDRATIGPPDRERPPGPAHRGLKRLGRGTPEGGCRRPAALAPTASHRQRGEVDPDEVVGVFPFRHVRQLPGRQRPPAAQPHSRTAARSRPAAPPPAVARGERPPRPVTRPAGRRARGRSRRSTPGFAAATPGFRPPTPGFARPTSRFAGRNPAGRAPPSRPAATRETSASGRSRWPNSLPPCRAGRGPAACGTAGSRRCGRGSSSRVRQRCPPCRGPGRGSA